MRDIVARVDINDKTRTVVCRVINQVYRREGNYKRQHMSTACFREIGERGKNCGHKAKCEHHSLVAKEAAY